MAEILTKDDLAKLGGVVEYDPENTKVEGLEALVTELRSMVAAQRAAIGAGGDQAESTAALVHAVQSLVVKSGSDGSGMTQKVLEGMLTQLARMPRNSRDPNPVYVFDIQRSSMGYITQIVATPTPAS